MAAVPQDDEPGASAVTNMPNVLMLVPKRCSEQTERMTLTRNVSPHRPRPLDAERLDRLDAGDVFDDMADI